MRKIIYTLFSFIICTAAFSCPVCERNKPKFLQSITHGNGPENNWDYVIVAIMCIVALLTLIYSIKFFIRPNESNAEHIKYSFLNEQ